MVSDFQPQGQPGLTQKLQQVVKDLQEIDKLRPSVADILVPMEVFDYIDGGRNPQLYTKDCMEKAHSKNEDIKGKIDAYRMFKARLLLELTHVFPKEMAVYRATRGDERGGQWPVPLHVDIHSIIIFIIFYRSVIADDIY